MVSLGKWIVAGSIGGAAGAAVWAMIAYFAHAEVGWIAWGIGAVVGICIRFVSGESQEGLGPGIAAALIAILSVLGGKYAAVSMLVASLDLGAETLVLTDEQMIATLADEIVGELQAKGKKVVFPAGKTLEDASGQADYPPAIWKSAAQRWTALGPAKQKERREEQQKQYAAVMGAVRGALHERAFAESFSLFDALWFFLAAATAFRLGAGNVGSEDDD